MNCEYVCSVESVAPHHVSGAASVTVDPFGTLVNCAWARPTSAIWLFVHDRRATIRCNAFYRVTARQHYLPAALYPILAMKLSTVPGVEVTILGANDVALREYDHGASDLGDDKTGTRYVEAISGSNFSVCFKAYKEGLRANDQDCLLAAIYLDGKHAISKVLRIDQHPYPLFHMHQSGVESNIGGQSVLQKFEFAALKTSDDSPHNVDSSAYKKLGEISVCLTLVSQSTEQALFPSRSGLESAAAGTIPEKCLKVWC